MAETDIEKEALSPAGWPSNEKMRIEERDAVLLAWRAATTRGEEPASSSSRYGGTVFRTDFREGANNHQELNQPGGNDRVRLTLPNLRVETMKPGLLTIKHRGTKRVTY